jgi:AraC-like DNA-binding protein
MAYQLQLKMAEAKKLLMQQVSILDVCYELGFYDQAHFTREFYKMNGLSPSIYQENINE